MLATALAASVMILPAGVGHGSPKPCRPLILDPRGDLEAGLAPGAPDRPDLDVLAVDLGTRDDTLIVTLAMAASPPTIPLPAGLIDVTFDIGSTTYNAYKYSGIDETIYGFNNPAGGHAVTGTTDARTGQVRISVPQKLIRASARAPVRALTAHTEELLGTNATAMGHLRDSAGSRLTHRLGSRGCL